MFLTCLFTTQAEDKYKYKYRIKKKYNTTTDSTRYIYIDKTRENKY